MSKRIYKLIVWVVLLHMVLLVGCQKDESVVNANDQGQLHIYATIFPLYDIAKQIGGSQVQVEVLTPIGGDSHDYEPSVKEMMAVYDSDLFIYNGAGYEGWIDHVVQNLDLSRTKVIDASQVVPNIQYVNPEEEHEEDDHGHEAHHHHDHEFGVDPHIWLDPMNVIAIADQIRQYLMELDPEHQAYYAENYERYAQELMDLDQSYREALSKATKREIVVSHSAYQYLADRYGFVQIAISGLSPSSEPSMKELQNLIEVMKEHNLKYVAFDAIVQDQVSQTVSREAQAEAVSLYTIENVTKDQFEKGITYLDLMQENLATLKKVLEVHE